jgi:hypothetical protein
MTRSVECIDAVGVAVEPRQRAAKKQARTQDVVVADARFSSKKVAESAQFSSTRNKGNDGEKTRRTLAPSAQGDQFVLVDGSGLAAHQRLFVLLLVLVLANIHDNFREF